MKDKEHSRFMIAAVHAYHRSERDSFARLSEAMTGHKSIYASHRIDRNRNCSKLWFWALKRWGAEDWPKLECKMFMDSRAEESHKK